MEAYVSAFEDFKGRTWKRAFVHGCHIVPNAQPLALEPSAVAFWNRKKAATKKLSSPISSTKHKFMSKGTKKALKSQNDDKVVPPIDDEDLSDFSETSPLGGKENYRWHNWANIFSCTPKLYYEPTEKQEIIEILHLAKQSDEKVKVVGESHSPNDSAVTAGHMISLRHFNRILAIDKHAKTVKVEAGIKLDYLNEELSRNGLAMRSLGSISEQSIGGAIGTGTHGTGLHFGIYASDILELELISASGETIRCSKTERADVFSAALCHLGALGVIYSVTIQCEPAFLLHGVERPINLNTFLANMNALLSANEHVRLWWVPHTEHCYLWTANRTHRKPTKTSRMDIMRKILNYLIFSKMLEPILYLCTFIPRLLRLVNRFYALFLFGRKREVVERSDRVFNFDCGFKQYVSEWAVPLGNATTALLSIKDFLEESKLNVHFSIEVRFTAEDDIWLSPSYQQDSCWIGIIMFRPFGKDPPGVREYFEGVEQIMLELEGRPHWAKAFKVGDTEFGELYPKWGDFLKIREQLDPSPHLFGNEFTERVFGS